MPVLPCVTDGWVGSGGFQGCFGHRDGLVGWEEFVMTESDGREGFNHHGHGFG